MNPVYGIHLRLHRAYEHLSELASANEAFLRSRPYAFWRVDHPEERSASWKVEIFEPPPLRLSLIVADCVHNMRSALDHLMWQLASKYKNGAPSSRTQFPICVTEKSWRRVRASVSFLPSEVLRYLELLQPFRASRILEGEKKTILHLLHNLWNREKHRELSELCFLMSLDCEPSTGFRFEVLQTTIREGASTIATAEALGSGTLPNITVSVNSKVALSERPSDGVGETLDLIHRGIADTLLPPFERFLLGD